MHQHITILGNVGNVQDLRYTQGGVAVISFSVAVNRKWDGGEETTWWKVAAWRHTAEIVAEYVKKGDKIMVTASRIEVDQWQTRDGEARADLKVTADRVILLGSRDSSNSNSQRPTTENVPF